MEVSSPSKIARVNPTLGINKLCGLCFIPQISHAAVATPERRKVTENSYLFGKPGDNFTKPSVWIRVLHLHLPSVIGPAREENYQPSGHGIGIYLEDKQLDKSPSNTTKLGTSAWCGCSLWTRGFRGTQQFLPGSVIYIGSELVFSFSPL